MPAILTETIQHHLTRYLLSEPHIVKQLAESFYVDDFTSGVYSEEEGFKLYQRAKEIMLAGSFNLRKWRTNSVLLQQRITEAEEKSLNVAPSQKAEPCRIKILGLSWDIETDKIYFDLKAVIAVATSLPPTRRSVLKISIKLFDPQEVISPFIIGIRIMFQLLCKDKVDWDQELEGHVLKRWKQLTKEFEALSKIKIPRCYYLVGHTPVLQQTHGFCDASERAYAATIYLRSVYDNDDVRVCLTSAKMCVALLKRQTIPQLELLGAMILARLVDRILSCLTGNPEIYCWTDSFAVLCWIKNKKTWRQYVQHRVAEIHRLTNQDVWRFCPGPENLADVASQSCSGQELINHNLWWTGPEFLRNPPDCWPDLPTQYESAVANEEIIKSPPIITHSLVSLAEQDDTRNLSRLFDMTMYGTKLKLLRVTGLVLKYVDMLKAKGGRSVCKLEAKDLREAEVLWIKDNQRQCFADEYRKLHWGKMHTVIYKGHLNLFLNDDKLIYCKGHLEHADLPVSSKNPVILPTKHCFTELLIKKKHQLVLHNGIQETLSAIREGYWIVRGREAVKKVVRRCIVCREDMKENHIQPHLLHLYISTSKC